MQDKNSNPLRAKFLNQYHLIRKKIRWSKCVRVYLCPDISLFCLLLVVFEKLVNRVLINVIIGSWIQCATATKSAADTAIVATTRPSILRRKQKRMISSMQTRGSVYLCRKKIILAAKRLVFIFHWRCCNYLALFLNLREAWDEIDWMWFDLSCAINECKYGLWG